MDDPEIPLRIYIERVLVYIEKLSDEREKRYLDKFEAIDKHMERSLAALHESRSNVQWGTSQIVAIVLMLNAVVYIEVGA